MKKKREETQEQCILKYFSPYGAKIFIKNLNDNKYRLVVEIFTSAKFTRVRV